MDLKQDYFFNGYLAGLFDGAGQVWLSPNHPNKSNPEISITFPLQDWWLAHCFRQRIGFGNLKFKLRENVVIYNVNNIQGYLVILGRLGSELRTPKINQLNALVEWLNVHYNYNLKPCVLSQQPLKESS